MTEIKLTSSFLKLFIFQPISFFFNTLLLFWVKLDFIIKIYFNFKESLNEPTNLKKTPLDDHLKLFKAKPRSKIDLNYSESVEEKLPIAQPKLGMRQNKDRVSLKEKMMQIKKKPNTLPPIESRMESATQRVTNQPSQILFEKENSGLNAKEKAMLDFDRENSESDFTKPITKLSVSIEEPGSQVGFKTERMAVNMDDTIKPKLDSNFNFN